jgi:WD40 repeat protein
MAAEGSNLPDESERRTRVFISYSRRNLDTAERLVTDLEAQNFEAYLDKHNIVAGEPWQDRLRSLLESADTVLFLLSPDSIASKICDWEINEAERLTKRLLPVVIQDVSEDQVPGRLKRLHYVFLRDQDDRAAALAQLVVALRTDIYWIREHTRIAELANRWDAGQRLPAQLLHGDDINKAEDWSLHRPRDAPDLLAIIADFIGASRAEADAEQMRERLRHRRDIRRSRIITWGAAVATIIVSLLGWFFYQSAQQALTSQSQFLADLAQQQTASGDGITGMLLALEGLPDTNGSNLSQRFRPYVAAAELALDGSMRKSRESIVLYGYKDPTDDAAFSPDGKRVVTASGDGAVIVWDVDSGTSLLKIAEPSAILTAAFSRDGSKLLLASNTAALVVDATTGKELVALRMPELKGAAFGADDQKIITCSYDRTAKVIDLSSGKTLLTLNHPSWVDSAQISPDGSRILTASAEDPSHLTGGIFRIWDAKTGVILLTFKGHPNGGAHSASFSPDGKRIVTSGLDKTGRVWDAASGQEVLTLEGHTDQVFDATFSRDGLHIVTASMDKSARIWDAQKGRLEAILAGHEFYVMRASFSADGRHIVTASADRTSRIWDAVDVNQLPMFRPISTNAAFTSDGSRVVSLNFSADTSEIDVWDAKTGAIKGKLECPACEPISPAANVDKGDVLALSYNGDVYNLDRGEIIFHLHDQFGPDNAELTFGSDNTVLLSPDGKRLLLATNRVGARLYDLGSGSKVLELDHECPNEISCGILSAAFSADGTRIVTGSNDKTARVWDASSGKELSRLTAVTEVRSVAFSPDGTKVLTAAGLNAQLWNLSNGKILSELVGHKNTVYRVSFSSSGERILTASLDGSARVWTADGRGEVYRLDGGIAMTNAVFSPDQKFILTSFLDHSARVWSVPLSTEDLIGQAESRVPRCLTAEQRATFHLSGSAASWCSRLNKWPYDQR